MAVQDDLAAALSAIAAATTTLNTIGAQATAAIAQVTGTYNVRLATLTLQLYVNQITGLDSNPGTPAAPLRTLQAAIGKGPAGSYITILMQTDYTTDAVLIVRNKFVCIASDSAVRRKLNFGLMIDTSYTPSARLCLGFYLSGQAATVVCFGIGVVMPAMSAYGNYQDRNSAVMFRPNTPVECGAHMVSLTSCDLDIPATPFGALVLDSWPLVLNLADITLIGATTSMNGRIVRNVTSTAGTATSTQPQLLTNLLTV